MAGKRFELVKARLLALDDRDLETLSPIWGGKQLPAAQIFAMCLEHAGQIMYVRCLYAGAKRG